LLTEGQVSDYKGAAILQHLLPDTCTFLADGGYDASWLRESLKTKGMAVCIHHPEELGIQRFPLTKRYISGDILLKIHLAN